MTREDEIKRTLRETKRPPLKHYAAILLILAAALSVYFLFSSGIITFGTSISSSEQAQNIIGNVGEGVQEASSELDKISQILGIS